MNKFYQLVFGITLGKLKLVTRSLSGAGESDFNAFECICTVMIGFTTSQKIQIGAVKYQDGRHYIQFNR